MPETPLPGLFKARLAIVAALVLALDQWTKWWIEQRLSPADVIEVVPGLVNLTFVQNTGVAFGMFPAHGEFRGTLLLTLLGLGALLMVVVYFLRAPVTDQFLLWALALILGGAVGNLVDRLMWGSVTDFIDVYAGSHHWPTFNVADSAISVGLVLMAFEIVRPLRGRSASQQEAT